MSHDFDVLSTKRGGPDGHHLVQDGVEAHAAAREPARAGEDEQVADDLRGPIGFAINRLDLAAQVFGERTGGPHELEVAQDALQRVVQLVRDARHELAERGQLLRLRQPFAQLFALGFEPGLRREVARDDHAADPLALLIEQIGDRHQESALEHRVEDLAGERLMAARARPVRFMLREPADQFRSDVLGERPLDQLIARGADAGRERKVRVDDPAAAIGHCDEVGDRVERVLQLAARSHHVGKQLHVLDGARQLTPELVGAIEQRELAARLDADALEHNRAEGAACAAQRHRHGARDGVHVGRGDFGASAAHGRRRRRQHVVGADADAARDVLGIRRGL